MDYPLNMTLAAPDVGFAVANDEAEHQALTAAGYGPTWIAPAEPSNTKAAPKTKDPIKA